MNEFPYTLGDVLQINNIPISNKKSFRAPCPFCPGKKIAKDFGIDLSSEKFHCFSCGVSGRGGTVFHALLHNMSNKDAHIDIMQQLGLSNGNKPVERKTRYVPQEEDPVPVCDEASDAVKNIAYQKLIENLSLSKKHKEDLLSRGFTLQEIKTLEYVSFPEEFGDLFNIPKKIASEGVTLEGVPGFYTTKTKGVPALCQRNGGILIPYRNFFNQITGFQLRKNDEDIEVDEETGKKANKYSWIASGNCNKGCKAGTKVHFACDYTWNMELKRFQPLITNGTLGITEGALKGDLTHCITGFPFLCVPGVSCSNKEVIKLLPLLKEIGVVKILFAFDMDRVMNLNVAGALEELKKIFSDNEFEVCDLKWSNEIVSMNGIHGHFDPISTYIETTALARKHIEENTLNEILDRAKQIGKKNVIFAFKNRADISEKSQEFYRECKKACEKRQLTCVPAFWHLRLKGVDDYFACKKRNVDYITQSTPV